VEIVTGRAYRIVVRFPWGKRVETTCDQVWREVDGSIRWEPPEGFPHEPCLDGVVREEQTWVLGWCGGGCDVTVVISEGAGAPEP